ncbi:MAG TPA: YdcF family protein [Coleofasciculaceae cyanobacterium]|jgi:uncharacterized SAM-binding protein YcdF (DUF218 family)
MKLYHRKRWKFNSFGLVSCAFLLLLSIIPVRLTIASHQSPYPQAILTLGGGQLREEFTALFAKDFPSLEIWVSSGTEPENALAIFRAAGIPDTRVNLDRRAVDTVTNFTSLVADFKNRGIQHIYLITSDFHMPRAKAIATVVLGFWGIAFTPISIPTNQPPESWLHILRDISRAFLWVVTGRTGASLDSIRSAQASRRLH